MNNIVCRIPAPALQAVPDFAPILDPHPGTDWAAEAARARAWLFELPDRWDALTASERERLAERADDDLADITDAGDAGRDRSAYLKAREAIALVVQALVAADDAEGRTLRAELRSAPPERLQAVRERLAWLEHSERHGGEVVYAWGGA